MGRILTLSGDGRSSAADLLLKAGHPVSAPCGGRGKCGKCAVKLSGEGLPPPDGAELEKLTARQLADGYRLACRVVPTGHFTAVVAEEKLTVLTAGVSALPEFSPLPGEYGVAVDIGTTTVAVYLVELADGRVKDTRAFANPQAPWGADVITRIGNAGAREAMTEAIRRGIADAAVSFGVPREKLNCAAIGGNTAMSCYLCGVDPSPLAAVPFPCPSHFGTAVPAEALDLPLADGAQVFVMPCPAAYIGGDITAGMALSGLDTAEDTVLYLDVGTNGEIGLARGGEITLCAAAAGPAFEGAGISCGMPSLPGAVTSVARDGCPTVLGGGEAKGLCGSGLLDLTAYLLRSGVLESDGYLEDDYAAAPDVTLTPRDVRQLQLAKAAIRAGVDILLEERGLIAENVDRLLLAGGFGCSMDPVSAETIGLLPPGMAAKAVPVGNAAGAGCVGYLLSGDLRKRVGGISERCRVIELSEYPGFNDRFVDAMDFPEEFPG